MNDINSESIYEDIIFNQTKLEEKSLENITFDNCIFEDANFYKSIFSDCKFFNCKFIRSDLSLVKLPNSVIDNTLFQECKIQGINFTTLNWEKNISSNPLSFTNSQISYCSFNALNLKKLKIKNCIANDLDFSDCILTSSDFSGSDLKGSRFNNCKLDNSDFTKTKNYYINPVLNKLDGSKFTYPEVINLLDSFNIKIQ